MLRRRPWRPRTVAPQGPARPPLERGPYRPARAALHPRWLTRGAPRPPHGEAVLHGTDGVWNHQPAGLDWGGARVLQRSADPQRSRGTGRRRTGRQPPTPDRRGVNPGGLRRANAQLMSAVATIWRAGPRVTRAHALRKTPLASPEYCRAPVPRRGDWRISCSARHPPPPLLQVLAAEGRVSMHVDQTRTLGDVTITVEQAVANSD
jgi:hypothetical protein